MKCPNFLVCGNIVPEWLLRCKGGHCVQCDMSFGKVLEFSAEDEECPVCLETKPLVKLLKCEHKMCVTCFKRCWDGPEKPDYPPFPYPDREDEYEMAGKYDPILFDPLVLEYNWTCNRIDDEWETKYAQEKSLRQCPLCRKAMLVYG